MTYRVGLTGGIGSGKSTVALIFSELGVPVIDTDQISHKLTQADGLALNAIRQAFGDEYIDGNGALNRSKMRELIFADPKAAKRLENILHPLILHQSKEQSFSSTTPYILVVVPLLFESGNYLDWLDRTLTVDCTEETQIARASARDGLNKAIVKTIMDKQLSRSERLQLADDHIKNDGSLSELRAQILALHQQYLTLSQSRN